VKWFRTGNIRLSTLRRRRRRLLWSVSVCVLALMVGISMRLHEARQVETNSPPWRYGAADARFTLVFYADLECPYCKDYSPQLRRWIEANPDVNLQWHHLPLSIHEPATSVQARLVECAGRTGGHEKFWSAVQWVYDHTRSDGQGVPDWAAFPNTSAALTACTASEEIAAFVQEQVDTALASGITATPSLRLTDNTSGQSLALPGPVPGDVLLSAIDSLVAIEK